MTKRASSCTRFWKSNSLPGPPYTVNNRGWLPHSPSCSVTSKSQGASGQRASERPSGDRHPTGPSTVSMWAQETCAASQSWVPNGRRAGGMDPLTHTTAAHTPHVSLQAQQTAAPPSLDCPRFVPHKQPFSLEVLETSRHTSPHSLLAL